MSAARIVVATGMMAGYPEAGGMWCWLLSYLLGLKSLGHDLLWLDIFCRTTDERRNARVIDGFGTRVRRHDLDDSTALLVYERGASQATFDNARAIGQPIAQVRERVRDADLLWNIAGSVRQPMLSSFRCRRVFVDVDPGHLQVSAALDCDLGLGDHDTFLTLGLKPGTPGCQVPDVGMNWQTFLPFVHLPMWRVRPDPGPQAPFSTVTQWNWGELWWERRVLSFGKRDGYMRYVDLPARAGRPFLLAANMHPQDKSGDREALLRHGWSLADPHVVAASPERYGRFIARSRAEICCPKPIFRELNTGWVSDRSVAYLASGRPVLAEETGFSALVPSGQGLVPFSNAEQALSAVADIDANYERHAKAARELAEQYFSAEKQLPRMIEASGRPARPPAPA